MPVHEVDLDLDKGSKPWPSVVKARVGDTDVTIRAKVTSGGKAADLSGCTAKFVVLKPDLTYAEQPASASGSTLTATLAAESLAAPGSIRTAYFRVTKGGVRSSTSDVWMTVIPDAESLATGPSDNYISEVEELIKRLGEFEDAARAAESARAKAEQARVAADSGRGTAEMARAAAESARAAAETARAKAETVRASAEGARADAEAKRVQVETARVSEEGKRTSAESARAAAESLRAKAESARADAEGKRVQAESARVSEEGRRASAETARASAETARAEAETARGSAESSRAAEEGKRASSESARAAEESKRASSEQARSQVEADRSQAESARVKAESARAEAERKREEAQAKNNADQALNNEAIKKLSPVILQTGQYDPSTLEPTVTGEPNRVYFVPLSASRASAEGIPATAVEAGNLYVEWMWIDARWERMGQSSIEVRPISTADIDAVASGTSPQGESVLNLTGLSYVWVKLKGAFAALSHTHTTAQVSGLQAALDGKQPKGSYAAASHAHAASDTTFGTFAAERLPVVPASKGGTGQSSLAASAQALVASCGAGDGTPSDAEWYLCSYADGTGSSNQPVRRKMSALWTYIKAKADALYQPKGSYAPVAHTHTTAQVSGLQTALDGKQPKGDYAAASHTHAMAQVTGLDAALAGKAASSHSHTTAQVSGLDAALAGKAASSHAHAAATSSAAGFMSAADKSKLDGVAAGANRYTLPAATASALGGVKLSDSTSSASAASSGVAATPKAVKAVSDQVSELRDSVSRIACGYLGRKEIDSVGHVQLWTTDEFESAFGASPKDCCIYVNNAASGGSGIWLATPRWNGTAVFTTALTLTGGHIVSVSGGGDVPVNYLVAKVA